MGASVILFEIDLANEGIVAHAAPADEEVVRSDFAVDWCRLIAFDAKNFGSNIIRSSRGNNKVVSFEWLGSGSLLDWLIEDFGHVVD